MPEPKLIREPDNQIIKHFVVGAIYLLLGIVWEAVSRPIVPFTYNPGLSIIAVGLGVAAAASELYIRKWTQPIYYVVLFGVLFQSFAEHQSGLAVLLFGSLFHLTRGALRVYANLNS